MYVLTFFFVVIQEIVNVFIRTQFIIAGMMAKRSPRTPYPTGKRRPGTVASNSWSNILSIQTEHWLTMNILFEFKGHYMLGPRI